MSVNIAETFELLFDKNNNVAYKALQELQKQSEETDCVYPYMDRLSNMLDSDNSYLNNGYFLSHLFQLSNRACHHARRQVHPATAGPVTVLFPKVRFETASRLLIYGGGGQEEKRLFAGAAYLPLHKKAQFQ